MERSSLELSPVISYPEGLPIHFLTGKKYLFQTLFCIQSLSKVTKTKFRFILVDDGSFDTDIITQLGHQIHGAEIVTRLMVEQNLKNSLPQNSFKYIHNKRKVYPHLKKLTDIHTLPGSDWKLVIDSDMLFWDEPKSIISWLSQPNKPLYMQDCQESYGYSRKFIENLCGTKVPSLLNVGVIGLNSTQIDWRKIDDWICQLEEKEGASYFLEQALTAMLIGSIRATRLNSRKYVVNPKNDDISKEAVLHHYVDLSKEEYFRNAWQKI